MLISTDFIIIQSLYTYMGHTAYITALKNVDYHKNVKYVFFLLCQFIRAAKGN